MGGARTSVRAGMGMGVLVGLRLGLGVWSWVSCEFGSGA